MFGRRDNASAWFKRSQTLDKPIHRIIGKAGRMSEKHIGIGKIYVEKISLDKVHFLVLFFER